MILSESAWYSKAYFFIEDWWAYFCGEDYRADKYYHKKTNLCKFMRTFIFKLPIILISQAILYLSVAFTFFIFPTYFLGFHVYAVIIICIGGIIGGWIGLKFVLNTDFISSFKSKSTVDYPSFWDLVMLWLKARKEAVCPLINIKKDVEND